MKNDRSNEIGFFHAIGNVYACAVCGATAELSQHPTDGRLVIHCPNKKCSQFGNGETDTPIWYKLPVIGMQRCPDSVNPDEQIVDN